MTPWKVRSLGAYDDLKKEEFKSVSSSETMSESPNLETRLKALLEVEH